MWFGACGRARQPGARPYLLNSQLVKSFTNGIDKKDRQATLEGNAAAGTAPAQGPRRMPDSAEQLGPDLPGRLSPNAN